MARQLIDNLSAKWDPEKYTDEYRDNLMRVIQAKLKGKKPKLAGARDAAAADVVDLMARLRASLEGKAGGSRKGRTTLEPEGSEKTHRPGTGVRPGVRLRPCWKRSHAVCSSRNIAMILA